MKNLFVKIALVAASALFFGLLTGCNPEGEDLPFSVRVSNAGTNSLQLEVVTNGISVSEVAYIVNETADVQMQPLLVFADADSIVNVSSNRKFKIDSLFTYVMGDKVKKLLEADVDYYIHCAARTNEGFYNQTYMLKARTADYTNFTEMLSVVDTYHNGYKLRITAPASVKNNPEKYAVRYTFTCLPMYLMNKMKGIPDYEMLTTNAGMHTTRSYTLDFDNTNEVLYDDYGEPVIDERGETVWIHDPIVPGEPTVVLGAQFQWVEKDDPLCPYGWNSGYHLHTFDEERWLAEKETVQLSKTEGMEWENDEDTFWKGDFQRKFFVVDQPSEIPGADEDIIEVEEVELTAVKAVFNVIPSDDVELVCYALLDNATYNAVLPWLDNNESYMQWFVTSWLAVYELGAKTAPGAVTVTTDDLYYEGIEAETKYHLLMVALGDEEGKSQKFIDYTFTTPAKSKPAPEVVVTAHSLDNSKLYIDKEYHNEHAFYAHFNIKAPNKDLSTAFYAANYVKDWVSKLNSDKATYADVVTSGTSFTDKELAAINSDEGLDIKIPTVDGETTRLVVLGKNDEYTPNDLKVKNPADSKAIADYTAPHAIGEPPVNSTLFEDLQGEWTATATICFSEYVLDENDNQVLTRTLHEWKSNVLISDAYEDFPSVLPESVYDAYKVSMGEKYDKTMVDYWYDDFKTQAQNYNKYRLSHQNRLLVQGIVDYDPYDRLDSVSPYELFCHDKYSSYNAAQIFYDFGPKWYLDIEEGDVVTVPFSYESMAPVTNWQDVSYYLCAMWYDMNDNQNSTSAFVEAADDRGFPVEISDDKNTITIKAIPNEDDPNKPLYLNVVAIQNGVPSAYAPFMSELVLTRGWTDHETTVDDISAKAKTIRVNAVDSKGVPVAPKEMAVIKSMTKLEAPKQLPVENLELIRMETLREKLEKSAGRMIERKYMPHE